MNRTIFIRLEVSGVGEQAVKEFHVKLPVTYVGVRILGEVQA
jgi:hypothetical protein